MSKSREEGGREVCEDRVEGDDVGEAGLERARGGVRVEVGAEIDCEGEGSADVQGEDGQGKLTAAVLATNLTEESRDTPAAGAGDGAG